MFLQVSIISAINFSFLSLSVSLAAMYIGQPVQINPQYEIISSNAVNLFSSTLLLNRFQILFLVMPAQMSLIFPCRLTIDMFPLHAIRVLYSQLLPIQTQLFCHQQKLIPIYTGLQIPLNEIVSR